MLIDIRPDEQLASITRRADEQPALTYLASLGRGSQRTQWSALALVAAILSSGQCTPLTLPWHALRRQHVAAVRAWLVEQRAPATGNRVLAALRGAIREAWRMEQMPTDAYMRALDIKPIRGASGSPAAGRALSRGEQGAMVAACNADPTPAGPRNAAIFGLATLGGLRRAEIVGLTVADWERESNQVWVVGKGKKRRNVYLAPGVDDALADWLAVGRVETGPIFRHINRGGLVQAAPLSPHAVAAILARVAQRAGVRAFTPHDLRRTFAGDMLDAGADIATVQKLMGHASVATTGRYDRRDERAKQSAAQRLHLPYVRRVG